MRNVVLLASALALAGCVAYEPVPAPAPVVVYPAPPTVYYPAPPRVYYKPEGPVYYGPPVYGTFNFHYRGRW